MAMRRSATQRVGQCLAWPVHPHSYNHLDGIHEKPTIKPFIGENTNMLNTNWTQHRTDIQEFLPHLGRAFH